VAASRGLLAIAKFWFIISYFRFSSDLPHLRVRTIQFCSVSA